MHIVIFTDFHDSTIGGIPTSIRGQRKSLEKQGHIVTIVSPPPTGPVAGDSSTIIVPSVPCLRPNGFSMSAPSKRNVRLVERALDARPPIDIIHGQTNIGVGIIGARIAKKRSIPLVQTMHGREDALARETYPFPALMTTIAWLIHRVLVPYSIRVPRLGEDFTSHNSWKIMVNHAQTADYVVTPSNHFLARLREHGLTRPAEAISNGIDDELMANIPRRDHATIAGSGPLRIIWVGRLSSEKRLLESIRAVSDIDDCVLDIYGEGALQQKAQAYINAHHLSRRVFLRGRVDQAAILKAMHDHDVLLYPSYGFDTQAIVILEAVATGTPIIYCDSDLVESMPAGGGILTRDQSVSAIREAILRVHDSPEQLKRSAIIMDKHRKSVLQSYYTKRMITLYQDVINGKNR